MSTWSELLDSATTDDIVVPATIGHVVEIPSTETPAHGFQTLLTNRILSAPVYNEAEKKYVGFLDMRDFVSFVVFFYHGEAEGGCSFVNIMREGLKSFNTPVDGITLSYLARRHPFRPVSNGASLREVVGKLSGSVHRVPVVNEEGRVVKIISQMSIVEWISKKLSLVDASQTVRSLNLGSHNVISVHKSTPAIETFKLMETHNLSGLAVVDERGALCGATSARDLKGFLFNPSLEHLQLPIFEFLKEIRQESLDITTPTITVSGESTLAIVIGKLAATRVHRVFAIDNERNFHPTAVISVSDIVRLISQL